MPTNDNYPELPKIPVSEFYGGGNVTVRTEGSVNIIEMDPNLKFVTINAAGVEAIRILSEGAIRITADPAS